MFKAGVGNLLIHNFLIINLLNTSYILHFDGQLPSAPACNGQVYLPAASAATGGQLCFARSAIGALF